MFHGGNTFPVVWNKKEKRMSTKYDIWLKSFNFTAYGQTGTVALTNFAGKNYPSIVDALMVELLDIKPTERVLDIGGGDSPFKRADVVTDAFLSDSSHRGGRDISKNKQYVQCFAESMPFKDKEFDFAFTRHVLEHVVEPAKACEEIMRVAKRGFIEVPSKINEYVFGYPAHRWLISLVDGVLVFQRRPFIRSPSLNVLRLHWYEDSDFRFRWELTFRNISCTQLAWDGRFEYKIIDDGEGLFDYDNPEHASLAHLDFALNALLLGEAPIDEIKAEIQSALRYKPDCALAHNALGYVLWQEKQYDKAREHFLQSCHLEPTNATFKRNSQLSQTDIPKLVELPPEPRGEVPPCNFAGRAYPSFKGYDKQLVDVLNIAEDERVLDVGGGAFPFLRADVVIDNDQIEETHRQGMLIDKSKRYIQCSAECMPFADNQFDFVFCRDVLEHVDAPASVCEELMRVGKRGYIEVPSSMWEYCYGHPTHRWLIEYVNGVKDDGEADIFLVFKRKRFAHNPFKSPMLKYLYHHPEVQYRWEVAYRNVPMIQFEWQGSFQYRVEDYPDSEYDYHRTDDAVASHLDYATNLFLYNLVSVAKPSVDAVLKLQPDNATALNLLGVINWKEGKQSESFECFESAHQLAPQNESIAKNYREVAQALGRSSAMMGNAAPEQSDSSRWGDIYKEAPPYDVLTSMPFLRIFLQKTLEYCRNGTALETGIGTGYGSIWLSKRGVICEGIDYSQEVVKQAILHNGQLSGLARFYFGDMFKLDQFISKEYDVIFHQGVLEHYSDEEIREILSQQIKHTAYVVFSVPSINYPFEKEFGDERFMSLADWQNTLKPFDVAELAYYGDQNLGGQEHILGVIRGSRTKKSVALPNRHGSVSPIVWNAPIYDASGFADEARSFVSALDEINADMYLRPIKWSSILTELDDTETARFARLSQKPFPSHNYVNVWHVFPPSVFQRDDNAILNACRVMFDSDRIPGDWVAGCNLMDEVWVPTEHNLDTFARSGVERNKLVKIPGMIDVLRFNPDEITPMLIEERRGYNFLSIFDWQLRKGWDILIKGYLSAFTTEDDVALIIKTYSSAGHNTEEIKEEINQYIISLGYQPNEHPPIILLDKILAVSEMPGLYKCCDAFVLPSHSEGWGRPYMEAMAMGLPTIGTRWSGNLEFMNDDNSYLINIDGLEEVSGASLSQLPMYKGHRWAVPSVTHLQELMRYVFENREEAKAVGSQAREHILTHYSQPVVAAKILAHLNQRLEDKLAPTQNQTIRQKYSLYHTEGREESIKAWQTPYAALFLGRQNVLDVGSGPGLFLELLCERGVPALGIDYDAQMVAVCKEKGLNAKLANATTISQYSSEFDGIHAGHIIEHLNGEQAIQFLEGCFTALKPGGLLVVRTPNWENETVRNGGFWLDHTHVRPYPLELLERIFLDLGLEIVQKGTESTGWNDTFIVGQKQSDDATTRPSTTQISELSSEQKKAQALPTLLTIAWEGSQFVNHSLAFVNREMCIALAQSQKCELSIIPYEAHQFGVEVAPERFNFIEERLNKQLSKPADFHVRHQWPPKFKPPEEGHWILMQPWEYGSMPNTWLPYFRDEVDEIWVYSHYNRDCYIQDGVPPDKVVVIPLAVDCEKFSPSAGLLRLIAEKTDKKFKFLFVGGTIWRKGIDVLLDAYARAFSKDDDVCLVIKDMGHNSFYKGQTATEKIQAIQSDENAPDIVYLTDMLSDSEIAGLYAACDCLVHPYRGEGFGLPVAEAMASGLPVILSKGGACDDFCLDDGVYWIPTQRAWADIEYDTVNKPWVLQPDADGLVELMKHVATHQDEAKEKGEKASEHIRQTLSWEKTAQAILDRLDALKNKPILRCSKEQMGNLAQNIDSNSSQVGNTTPNVDSEALTSSKEYNELAKQLCQEDKLDEAEVKFKQAIRLDKNFVQPYNNLAVLYWQQERIGAAISMLNQAMSIAPDDIDVIVNYGLMCKELDKPEEAIKIFEAYLERNPGNEEVESLLNNLIQSS